MKDSSQRTLLLGGPPRCGKSTLAKVFIKKHGYNCVNTDIIAQVFHATTKELDIDVDHPLQRKRETFLPVLRMFIKTLSFYDDAYIVEGDVISPDICADMPKEWGFFPVFLGDKNVTANLLRLRTGSNDWITGSSPERLEELARLIRDDSAAIEKACRQHNFLYVEIDAIKNTPEHLYKTISTIMDRQRN